MFCSPGLFQFLVTHFLILLVELMSSASSDASEFSLLSNQSDLSQYLCFLHHLDLNDGEMCQQLRAEQQSTGNTQHKKVFFRGIWVIHLVPRKTYNTDVSKIFGLGQQGVVESMFVAAGTQNCVTELSSSSSSDDDDKQASLLMMMLLNNDSSSSRAGILLYPRSFGPYTHWMNSQEIILFSKPKFQGKQVNIKLFDNDTVSHIEDFDTGFFPRSSIVINSDWNINTGEDVFCLLGRNDVVFLSDWVSEGYISKPATLKKMMGNHSQNNNDYQQQQQQELFPQVEPGCYSRPQQVAELLDKPWSGTHFCHFAQLS